MTGSQRSSRVILLSCGVAGMLAMLLVALGQKLSQSIEAEIRLAQNIGEILRLDEVLTMSARLYAATQDISYQQRYEGNVHNLDAIIVETFVLIPDRAAHEAVEATNSANQALVEIERRALELGKSGDWEQSLSLLQGPLYEDLKRKYSEGMASAMTLLTSAARQRTSLLWIGISALLTLSAVLLALLYRSWKLGIQTQIEYEKKHAQYEALRVTMRSVMDTFNNTLNNLLLLKMKAEEGKLLEPDDLALFDRVIYSASEQLHVMAAMSEYRTRKAGELELLDIVKPETVQ